MMKQRAYWLLGLGFLYFLGEVHAQVRSDGGLADQELVEDFKRQNYGLRMGAGVYTMLGSELKNPRPLFGYAGGFFAQKKISRTAPHWIYTELSARFAGANFANFELESDYTKISQIFLDVPVLWKFNLNTKATKDLGRNILIGIQGSHLLRSAIYLGPERVPKNKLIWWKRWEPLPLKPFDLNAMAAWEYAGEQSSLMISLRVGLINANRGFFLPDVTPATGNNGTIRNCSLEVSMLF
jgi:hypothetical protein